MEKSEAMRAERIFSESPIRDLWNRLAILANQQGALEFLTLKVADRSHQNHPETDLLDKKAEGIAFCIATAREYFQSNPERNLTTSALLYYYGTFSLFGALLLADVSNELTLKEIEEFSKDGHGLDNINTPGCPSLYTPHIYLRSRGFLFRFLEHTGVEASNFSIPKKLKSWDDVQEEHLSRLITIGDLLKRVPELMPICDEVLPEWPCYVAIAERRYGPKEDRTICFPSSRNSKHLCAEMIADILSSVEIQDLGAEREAIVLKETTKYETVLGEINNFALYGSPLAGEKIWIKPLFNNLKDPLVFHFMALYLISIFVRYQINVWRNMLSGKENALIAHYLRIVERIVPNLVLDRLYGKRFLFAPPAYWS